MRKIICIVLLGTLVGVNNSYSQNVFSPYTIIGLGDWSDRTMSHGFGMGEVGIGTPSVWNINSLNPALLTSNSLTTFELAILGESRKISNEDESERASSAGYRYLSLAFPVMRNRWTSNISYNPLSTVNYQFISSIPVQNSTSTSAVNYEGEGGLTEVTLSNGFRIFKGFSLGIETSYVFGLTEHATTSFLVGDEILDQFPLVVTEKTNYKGYTLGFGASYGKVLGESDHAIGFGIIYEMGKSLEGNRVVQFAAETLTGIELIGDTLSTRSVKDVFEMPAKLGLGVSWIKENFIKVGLDFTRSDWTRDAGFGSDTEEYRTAHTIALGVELTPKYDDVDNYIARIRYRVGVKYEQLPYILSGQELNDFGINFGLSLPVRGVSAFNMAFKVGQRGTLDSNLVKEQYFKFMVGATINDRWFVRRKYN